MSKPINKEQAREAFLEHVRSVARYWADPNVSCETVLERCEGVAFSILVLLDGGARLPAHDVVVRPHPEDKAYHIENDDDYYVDGIVINDDCQLHELFYKKDGKV